MIRLNTRCAYGCKIKIQGYTCVLYSCVVTHRKCVILDGQLVVLICKDYWWLRMLSSCSALHRSARYQAGPQLNVLRNQLGS